jgi:aryl-alcohol dehydrogenase-like predicted oxidoreductase
MRTLGPLEVSVVGLGCNNFGRRVDQTPRSGPA